MPLYHVKWPNGEHTIAFASGRAELAFGLDEVGNLDDAESVRILNKFFAVDVRYEQYDDGDSEGPFDRPVADVTPYEGASEIIREVLGNDDGHARKVGP